MKYYDIPYFRKLNTERSLTDFLSFQCYTTWIIDTNQRVLSGQKKKKIREFLEMKIKSLIPSTFHTS